MLQKKFGLHIPQINRLIIVSWLNMKGRTSSSNDGVGFTDIQFLTVSQNTVARNLGISPLTIYIIIKSFRESRRIFERNVGDLSVLRQHCNKNWHDCIKDIIKRAQEHFRKPLLVNTVCPCIDKRNAKVNYPQHLETVLIPLRWTNAK